MSGSSIGTLFKISTWGESHGKGLGVVIDGCPSGLSLCEEDIQLDLDRRKPGGSKFATPRTEEDKIHILSGVFEGKTTGTPISLVLFNEDQRSHDYGDIADVYRPGHADYPYDMKYGFRDYRGGGRSSGRETSGRVAAGAVARKILANLGIEITAYTTEIAGIAIDPNAFDLVEARNNPFNMPDKLAAEKVTIAMEQCIKNKDSAGGIVECVVTGLKPGIGEPVFGKLDAELSRAIMSMGATKGIEFGIGFKAPKLQGSENNDPFFIDESGRVAKRSNNAGGVLGGMSDGSDLIFRTAIKPTSSIGQPQKSINRNKENIDLVVEGRHDPLIASRAVIVVEAMTAITILDLLLINLTKKIDTIKIAYDSLARF